MSEVRASSQASRSCENMLQRRRADEGFTCQFALRVVVSFNGSLLLLLRDKAR